MAMAVSTIISDNGIQDTLLYAASRAVSGSSPFVNVRHLRSRLVLEFFRVASFRQSVPYHAFDRAVAAMTGVSGQTSVFAYALGDGFLNVLYPNPLLLIALGLTTVSLKWFKFTIGIQLVIMVLSVGFLMIASYRLLICSVSLRFSKSMNALHGGKKRPELLFRQHLNKAHRRSVDNSVTDAAAPAFARYDARREIFDKCSEITGWGMPGSRRSV